MYEPWGWKNEWYIDVVRIDWQTPESITLHDLLVDIIVEGDGPTYRMIDLDEVARDIRDGTSDPSTLADALETAQRFLDRHLHKAKDFPPRILRANLLP